MTLMTRQSGWRTEDGVDALGSREWMVTNALGGYAAGTVSGECSRRFHGLLVAALPAPAGRVMMFNHLLEEIEIQGGARLAMTSDELAVHPAAVTPVPFLREFAMEDGLPVWRYEAPGVALEKTILVAHQQNTVVVTYRVQAAAGPLTLRLRPSFQMRSHEGAVAVQLPRYVVHVDGRKCEVSSPDEHFPALRLTVTRDDAQLVLDGGSSRILAYRVERARGYDSEGPVWSPGFYQMTLNAGDAVSLVASVEAWETLSAMSPSELASAECERRRRLIGAADERVRSGAAAQLVFAADQFIITPQTRVADAARAHAAGDDARTVIAGYPWFTDWGRDTMISLEGLTLATGRHVEAGYILRTFARYVKDGLIPNMFPEGEKEGLYHTADASLWLFQAVNRFVETTRDLETRRLYLPIFRDIIAHHLAGTHFGIHVDPKDGLLAQGAPGYQLTWMDAKVGDWVVTPRRGKAIELNALYYNALRIVESWTREDGDTDAANAYAAHAERARASFNQRFWNTATGYCFDVVDGEQGDDPALRPNQVFAISLPHPVLDPAHWAAVVGIVREKLVTPVGLRSLGPGHPDYRSTYDGELRARDAAYHQGTVWGWLIGPFVDAWLRVHPDDRAGARRFLEGFGPHLGDACVGTISEIFDAESPFSPRGCTAQAWSVAEVLRSWVNTAEPR